MNPQRTCSSRPASRLRTPSSCSWQPLYLPPIENCLIKVEATISQIVREFLRLGYRLGSLGFGACYFHVQEQGRCSRNKWRAEGRSPGRRVSAKRIGSDDSLTGSCYPNQTGTVVGECRA